MTNRRGTPEAIESARQADTYTLTLPPAAVAIMQEANERIKEAQAELGNKVASMLAVLVTDGSYPTNVDIDTGVVTLTRGPSLTEVTQED